MKTKKKIIFFDGDGTLWYPKTTKRTKKPHWIYKDPIVGNSEEDYMKLLILTPYVKNTLRELKLRDIYSVIISTHPHPPKEAQKILGRKVHHFGLENLIREYHSSPDVPGGKGRVIETILKEKGMPKSQALMVGDSYHYDYLSAKTVGVDVLSVRTDYTVEWIKKYRIRRCIDTVRNILEFI